MNANTFPIIVCGILTLFFLAPGVTGLVTGELIVRSKYGRSTTYTGQKAKVMCSGYVLSGLIFGMGTVMAATNAKMMNVTLVPVMLAVLVVMVGSWVLSMFVSGEARKERG